MHEYRTRWLPIGFFYGLKTYLRASSFTFDQQMMSWYLGKNPIPSSLPRPAYDELRIESKYGRKKYQKFMKLRYVYNDLLLAIPCSVSNCTVHIQKINWRSGFTFHFRLYCLQLFIDWWMFNKNFSELSSRENRVQKFVYGHHNFFFFFTQLEPFNTEQYNPFFPLEVIMLFYFLVANHKMTRTVTTRHYI